MDYPLTFLHVPCHTQVPNKGKKYNNHVVFKTFFLKVHLQMLLG